METLKFHNPQLSNFLIEAKENEYPMSKTDIGHNSITFVMNEYTQFTFTYYDNKVARDEDFEQFKNYSLT